MSRMTASGGEHVDVVEALRKAADFGDLSNEDTADLLKLVGDVQLNGLGASPGRSDYVLEKLRALVVTLRDARIGQ